MKALESVREISRKSIGLAVLLILIVLLAAGCPSETPVPTPTATATPTPVPTPTATPTPVPTPTATATPTPVLAPEPRIVDGNTEESFENFDYTILVNCTVANFGVEGEVEVSSILTWDEGSNGQSVTKRRSLFLRRGAERTITLSFPEPAFASTNIRYNCSAKGVKGTTATTPSSTAYLDAVEDWLEDMDDLRLEWPDVPTPVDTLFALLWATDANNLQERAHAFAPPGGEYRDLNSYIVEAADDYAKAFELLWFGLRDNDNIMISGAEDSWKSAQRYYNLALEAMP